VIVLDGSVLIAHLDADDPHHHRADRLLADSAPEPLGASRVTLAEVLVAPARAGRVDRASSALHQLGVAQIPLGDDAPLRLAVLRAGTNLKLPDCCVLLAAEVVDATIATFDERLATVAEELGRPVLGSPER
jgi:predicted nucleic acid-binding protein